MIKTLLFGFCMLVASFAFVTSETSQKGQQQVLPAQNLRSNDAPDIDKEKSLKAFQTILAVIKSPRCMNCHPSGDVPRQGDVQRLHPSGVSRGESNHGGKVQKCATCHHTENMDFANVPGAPHWGLAPKSMGWFGLSDVEIGKKLLDKKSNGGRSPQDLVKHMSSDSLVLWAWNPGKGRSKPPVELEAWKIVLKEWLDNGAVIPTQ